MREQIASSVTLTQGDGVRINGIPFPFSVSQDVEIEPGGPGALTLVTLRLFVHGTVVYTDGKRHRVIDSELGDVGQWARDLVRTGLLEAHPWLRGI